MQPACIIIIQYPHGEEQHVFMQHSSAIKSHECSSCLLKQPKRHISLFWHPPRMLLALGAGGAVVVGGNILPAGWGPKFILPSNFGASVVVVASISSSWRSRSDVSLGFCALLGRASVATRQLSIKSLSVILIVCSQLE